MKNKLYLEYARVINMCKDTALEETPWTCVKNWGSNSNWLKWYPMFNGVVNIDEDAEIFKTSLFVILKENIK